MKKAIKIVIAVFVYPIIMTAYGLIIGGDTGLIYYAVMTFSALLLLLMIFGEEKVIKNYFIGFLILSIILAYFSEYLYFFTNKNMDDAVIDSYQSEVVDFYADSRGFDYVSFTDKEGQIKEYKLFSPMSVTSYDLGEDIMVYEYKGFFDLENYKIEPIE